MPFSFLIHKQLLSRLEEISLFLMQHFKGSLCLIWCSSMQGMDILYFLFFDNVVSSLFIIFEGFKFSKSSLKILKISTPCPLPNVHPKNYHHQFSFLSFNFHRSKRDIFHPFFLPNYKVWRFSITRSIRFSRQFINLGTPRARAKTISVTL